MTGILYFVWKPSSRMTACTLPSPHWDTLEAQIPEGLAFTYQQGIVVIVNLSFKHSVSSDVISSLAIILREGLFKMGVSSEFRDFLLIPQGYIQAVSALLPGQKKPEHGLVLSF